MEEIIAIIARKLNIKQQYIRSTIDLLEGGATVPFISRYRKEMTGSMDEVSVQNTLDLLLEYKELQARKEYILQTIETQGKLTDTLRMQISSSWDRVEIEDLYLPFKPKRKTRAQMAREKGLEPLAELIFSQKSQLPSLKSYLNDEVHDVESAIQGASDIIAELVSEDRRSRTMLRVLFERTATITSKVIKGKEEEGKKYTDYFDFQEPLRRCSSHRLLAMRRGQKEGILRIDISPADYALEKLQRLHVKEGFPCADIVKVAVEDSYRRLLKPSIENEFASVSKTEADTEAIEVFEKNLRALLLAPPLGARQLMAIDPGFRTGCKVVVIDKNGNLLHHETIFPHSKQDARVYAEMQILKIIDKYSLTTVAIGSGTAGRETRDFIDELGLDLDIYMVNEDGASVYSASEAARREFPDKDITVRGAVSIGRRLMDPLSELVKIDPKSIGVGQYQHDVDQTMLRKKLESVTGSCVNSVGVNLNTASPELLSYVSGLGPSLAQNIVEYRRQNGDFKNRKSLLKVNRIGAKAYEQSVAFLRIPGADNPLDNSAVHPESYYVVEMLAKESGHTLKEIISNPSLLDNINLERIIANGVGDETLKDILIELKKPGRDPRSKLSKMKYDESIKSIEDVREGMILPGIVSNVTNFGCFVDLGIKTKGLVHISQLSEKRVESPHCIVKPGQQVTVKVLDVDLDRKRIALTMKGVTQ